VLPFDNLSGDPEQEYFSDGITDSIILNLSAFPDLQVKSRNSSFAFKQQIKSIGEISDELGVDYVVEGSIRKSGQRIRITVQLIEAQSGNQIWGKRYDAELADLFDLEEDLSRTIAATVTGQIESDLQRIALAKGAADQQAYDLLLSGTYHYRKFTGPDIVIAIDELNRCLELDPNNVLAHSWLYYCHSMNWMERWVEDYKPSLELARKHARKAFELGPEVSAALIAYAEQLIFRRENGKAMIYIDKALAINPNDPDALAMKSLNLTTQARYEEALQAAELGCQLDPYHHWCDWCLAEAQFFCGQYEKALETIAISTNAPGFIRIYTIAANLKLDRPGQARKELQEFLSAARNEMLAMPQSRDEWLAYTVDNAPYEDSRINEKLIEYLYEAGLEEVLSSQQSQNVHEDLPSILVLPFNNLSGDPEQEYFSDGITESIILRLSSFGGLDIKSRHASFAYKNSSRSMEEIAADLNVKYVVEGSVRKLGERIRITVGLGDIVSGNQLWGKRFDSQPDDCRYHQHQGRQGSPLDCAAKTGEGFKKLRLLYARLLSPRTVYRKRYQYRNRAAREMPGTRSR
jgi:TolB-like protein